MLVAAALLFGALPQDADRRPGLVARYESAGGASVESIEPRVAGNWPAGTSPHPAIAAERFKILWSGFLRVPRAATYKLTPNARGRFAMSIGGRAVREGDAQSLEPGDLAFEATFEKTGDDARVQLLWESDDFGRVPIPASAFVHDAAREPDLAAERGRRLFEAHRCGACHARADAAEPLPSPDLSAIGARAKTPWIAQWLAAPARFRAGAEMPAMFAEVKGPTDDDDPAVERAEVARYLASLGAGKRAGTVKAKAHGGAHEPSAERGAELFALRGCAACHPAPVPLGALGSKYELDPLANFLKTPLKFHPAGTMPDFTMGDEECLDLAAHLVTTRDAAFEKPIAEGSAAEGKELVGKYGCLACHKIEGFEAPKPKAPSFDQGWALREKPGCAGGPPIPDAVPRYTLDAVSLSDLDAFLKKPALAKPTPAPAWEARATIDRFRCLQCHARDGEGGGLAEKQKSALGGDASKLEQVAPPDLSGVGGKLRSEWMAQLFEKRARARPWLEVRMPHFGSAPVAALARELALLDGEDLSSPLPKPSDDAKLGLVGRDLVSKSGFGCIACHDLAGAEAKVAFVDARGPDLMLTPERVRRSWFDRWLLDPQALSPGTKMPAYFPGGQSTLAGRHALDTPGQIDALYRYFALGEKAPLPEGLRNRGGWSWVPSGRPALIRTPFDGAPRSIAVGFPGGASLEYDAGRGMLREVWVGGFLKMDGTQWTGDHGPYPTPEGRVVRKLETFPWAFPPEMEKGVAPAPRDPHARFLGYDEKDGNFTFRVAVPAGDKSEVEVRERFVAGADGFDRHVTLREIPAGREAWFYLAEVRASEIGIVTMQPIPPGTMTGDFSSAHVPGSSAVRAIDPPNGSELITSGDACWLRIPAAAAPRTVSFVVATRIDERGSPDDGTHPFELLSERFDAAPASRDSFEAAPLVEPSFDGVPVKGERPFALEEKSYALETLPIPESIVLQAGGLDFFPDGTLAVCTRRGEVWLVEHATKSPAEFRWLRFAHGLHEPLGLKVEGKDLVVLQKPELTRLRDTDGDGVADRYETINAEWGISTNFHQFAFGLERGADGSYFGTLGLAIKPGGATRPEQEFARGSAWRVTPEGKFEVLALGARTPNGTGLGANGEFYYSDNQGDYIPACKLVEVKKGEFYGQRYSLPDRDAKVEVTPPVCWFPFGVVSQSASDILLEDRAGKFGPFAGQLLVGEFTNSQILRVALERVKGRQQGACFILRRGFGSGVTRLAFGPDDRLYVGQTTGGWGARGGKLFALERVAFTGVVPFEMKSVHLLRDGFEIEFTKPLAPGAGEAASSYAVEQFRYHYWETYGSPEIDRKALPVSAAAVSPDRRKVTITVANLVKDRICEIRLRGITSQDGDPLVHAEAWYTLNEFPE